MEINEKILVYLSVHGKENKHRLASALNLNGDEVREALIELEKEGKIEMKGGRVFLVKGKKPVTIKMRKKKEKKPEEKFEEVKEEASIREAEAKVPSEEAPLKEIKKEVIEEQPGETKEEKQKDELLKEEKEEETKFKKVIKEERIEGSVKFFNVNKGFGFIRGDDGKDYYVHKSALKEGVTIEMNNRVSFKVVQGDKGPKAEEVEWISQA